MQRILRITLPAVALALAIVFGAACASGTGSKTGRTLIVGAASDVQFAFEEIAPLFRQEKGIEVQFTFGGSGSLARQIENGAPIDVFVAADEDFVAQLQQQGLILDDTRRVYALGHLALVTNRAAGAGVTRPEDLIRPEVKHVAIANPDIAPYGRAAHQALERAGLWDQIKPKLVYGENVRQALQFVQAGDAEAGFVAASLAGVPEVTSMLVDGALYDPLRQTLAVVRSTRNEAAAREFVGFLTGTRGAGIMKKYGFDLPPGP